MGLDNYLEVLRGGGERESEGQFTIALEKAALKLAEFRLAKREDFALHLLRSAVLGQATLFQVMPEENDRISFFFNGQPLTDSDILDAIENRSKGASERVKQLQIALSAVHGKEETQLSIRGPRFSQTLVLKCGNVDFFPQASHSQEGCLLQTYWPGWQSIVARMRESACYAPLELRAKGELISLPLDFGFSERNVHAVSHFVGSESLPVANYTISSRRVWFEEEVDSTKPYCYMALTNDDTRSTFHCISNGVVLTNEPVPYDFSMISGAASVSHLPKDLSRSGLAKTAAYEKFCKDLQARIRSFLVRYCKSKPQLPVATQATFCRQLRNFFGPECPDSILHYLAETESVLFVTGREQVLEFRQRYAEEAGGLKVRRLMQLYEEHAFSHWKALHVLQLGQLMDDYRALALKTGMRERGILDSSQFLKDATSEFKWSDVVHDTEEATSRRVRAFLMSKNEAFDSSLCADAPSWRNLIPFFLDSPESVSDYGEDELLRSLHQFRTGALTTVIPLCRLIENDPRTRNVSAFWFSAITRLVRGQIKWFQQIKLMVRFSSSSLTPVESKWVSSLLRASEDVRNSKGLRELGSACRQKTFFALFFWSLPAFRTSRYEEMARQALLWESYYRIEGKLDFDLPLSHKPFAE